MSGLPRRGVLVAVLVASAVVLSGVRADGVPDEPERRPAPRFMLTAGSSGGRAPGLKPWFQVYALTAAGRETLVETVPAPADSPGEVHTIVGGPGGVFMAVASHTTPCASQVYRFRLTHDGRVTGLAPVGGTATPGVVGGLAASPDGHRIAYATAPCAAAPDPGALASGRPVPEISPGAVTVLDLATGNRRTWTTIDPVIVGEIVWARDSRTLGYAVTEVASAAVGDRRTAVGAVTVYALDTGAAGIDLRSGRLLFGSPDSSHVVTSVVMDPDGRGGFGVMRTAQPPATVVFTFAARRPIKVLSTIPDKPNTLSAMSFSSGTGPRYACLSGIDAFDRVFAGMFTSRSSPLCAVATDPPS